MSGKRPIYWGVCLFLVAGFFASLVVGKYPLTLTQLLQRDGTQWSVFLNLRLARSLMALLAGFGLAVTGYVYQTVFKNAIASPDMMGVSSGACVGAGVAIVWMSASPGATTLCAFAGGIVAVLLAMTFARLAQEQRIATFVLAGVAVNALAEALLMLIKMTADPFGKLAALEFWTMGSFASVRAGKILPIFPVAVGALALLFLLYRQMTLLALDSDEASMLGVPVTRMRCVVVLTATLAVSVMVSVVGKITFIGLIAPHIVRLLLKEHSGRTMLMAGILGSGIVLWADCLARSLGATEIPISILTSLLGAPLLVGLVMKGGKVA